MKACYPATGLSRICTLFGITRQSFYQNQWRYISMSMEHKLILEEVNRIRANHRSMGTRKLYEKLQDFLLEHQIKTGRDALFELLACHGLLVRRRKRTVTTTMSYHRYHKWPNLIKGMNITEKEQLFVSDITYWKIATGYIYISLITDAYSHKIVGYNVSDNLESIESKKALEMALHGFDGHASQLIHHSDRGIQYCSYEYVKLLQQHNIRISMTETSEPTDNAVAERVNRIIKEEYLNHYDIKTLTQARVMLKKVIRLYNEERPHLSIGLLTPQKVHSSNIKTEKLWMDYSAKKRKIAKESLLINEL